MDFEDRGDGDLTLKIEKLTKELEELKTEFAREKEDRQYENLVHQKELQRLLKLDGSGV
jgi:hypothetical protein